MKSYALAFCLSFPGLVAGGVARAQNGQALPVDEEITINGTQVACTGIGDEAISDPRWPAYSVRTEFADGKAEYLSEMDISIATAKGVTILKARCDGPWFLAKLRPGKYKVSATFDGRLTKTARFTAPAGGQSRTIVRFPELGADQ